MNRQPDPPAAEPDPSPPPDFTPVPVRPRLDGWTVERQIGFIQALAESGCVVEACRSVGMSVEGAYRLCRRPDAQSFRIAWETAMDNAVRRLADAATGRAIHGIAVPHYFQGEKIGEHRRFDERLTMFILRNRYRDRYGDAIAKAPDGDHPERIAVALYDALRLVIRDAIHELNGEPRTFIRNFPDADAGWDEAIAKASAARRREAGGAADPEGHGRGVA